MTKKKSLFIIPILILILFICFNIYKNFTIADRTSINKSSIVSVEFEKQKLELKQNESEFIKKIFNNKKLYEDNFVMCPFGYVSINISCGAFSETFYPATDGCNTIKFKNKIFHISENANKKMLKILTSYGVKLPHI